MIALTVTMDLDQAPWTDAKAAPFGEIDRVGRLRNGTSSGASVVAISIRMPDGKVILGQTTLALLENAVRAFVVADGKADS